jgi:hypothetical protein
MSGAAEADAGLPVFAGVHWRAPGLARHASHGPGAEVGVELVDGWLRLGLAIYARPGPLNPRTFVVELPPGTTYRGASKLALRSDGMFVGGFASAVVPIPHADRWRIELPISVGLAGYGFYLHGEERETPDGRRVSAWENELLDGRDSSNVLGVEVGARLLFRAADWLELFVGLHYAWAIGYDTAVRSSYDGPSLALGARVGGFHRARR